MEGAVDGEVDAAVDHGRLGRRGTGSYEVRLDGLSEEARLGVGKDMVAGQDYVVGELAAVVRVGAVDADVVGG